MPPPAETPGRRAPTRGLMGLLRRIVPARIVPRSLQARLTLAFVGVVVLTLAIMSIVVINRVDDYFYAETQADLDARAASVRDVVVAALRGQNAPQPVVYPDGTVNPGVGQLLESDTDRSLIADLLAQANVVITIGQPTIDSHGAVSIAARPDGVFTAAHTSPPRPGQASDPIIRTTDVQIINPRSVSPYAIQVRLSDPYTFRASAVANVAGLLAIVGLFSLALAVVVAAIAARRFSTPIRLLTDAARGIAEGDYSRRVPANLARTGATELAELSRQFNMMAAQLGESVEIIRRDRDRSRDFLADVSHELRTPIAALRTFNELLREGAATDPDTRAEFLESSRQQIERLDWLATNLLELSKLDSGLVLLDLRPDDLRACVESAVEQAGPAARRRGIDLRLALPKHPLRIRHDPQRIGQVIGNLVGNALKFTPRGGRVTVTVRPSGDGAQIVVADTGVGIDLAELPHIFERFFRGSRANEARGSGSGLGLAIVKSIVDMHAGRVAVDSRVGGGSTFTVTLPPDPRLEPPAREVAVEPEPSLGQGEPALREPDPGAPVPAAARRVANVIDSSPSPAPGLNPPPSG
jgi:signal transduction histidine kinase